MKKQTVDALADLQLHTRETHSLMMTAKDKMNARRHELRHFNIIIFTFFHRLHVTDVQCRADNLKKKNNANFARCR